MKTRGVVNILVIVAVGLLGLAPVAVCEMPPACPPGVGGVCPMQQPSGHHVCCQPADGMAAAPCHPVHPAAAPILFSKVTTALTAVALPIVPNTARPSTWLRTNGAEIPASPVPRFLLTHTFRL